jgi:hypothetical protein
MSTEIAPNTPDMYEKKSDEVHVLSPSAPIVPNGYNNHKTFEELKERFEKEMKTTHSSRTALKTDYCIMYLRAILKQFPEKFEEECERVALSMISPNDMSYEKIWRVRFAFAMGEHVSL